MENQTYPQSVEIFEVGPRDGLQNEEKFIETPDKVDLINKIIASGCKMVEITSFVSPKWVPQMKDAKEVVAAVGKPKGILLNALIPNMKGLEFAIDAGLEDVVTIMSASESHNTKNINMTVAQSLEQIKEINRVAAESRVKVRSYIGTAFGCPMEGDIPTSKVIEIALKLESYGSYQVSLGDTTGMATPLSSFAVCGGVQKALSKTTVAAHFHRAEGIEFANILAALHAGITIFDGAVGGLGGCPYAPGATGNAATEVMVEMFKRMDIDTGIDAQAIAECGALANKLVEE